MFWFLLLRETDIYCSFLRFRIKNFTTRQFFKIKYIFRKHEFEEKNFSKKHDFEEKINFMKQILKKMLHTKNHVLTQFTP